MRWSWKLGRVAGVDVYMHATFLILIAWVAVAHWLQGHSLSAVAAGVGFILALFGCVVLHELGHALVARRYGIGTRDITLLPIGGVARLERMPEDPGQELRVALAGPVVSLTIAGVLFAWVQITRTWQPLGQLAVAGGPLAERLMVINLVLAAFNLLPAFPMDGGRVLRAILARRMDRARATQVAATLGQGMAFLFALLGFFTNPFLLFIAFFVWLGATQEAGMVQTQSALSGVPLRRAMLTEVHTLLPQDSLARAVDAVLAGSQQDFPVLEEERVVGVLTRSDLLISLAQKGQGALVGEVMRRDLLMLEAAQPLEEGLAKLQQCDCHTAPVLEEGRLVGLVTMENIGEFLMIQAALRARDRGPVGDVPSSAPAEPPGPRS